MAVKLVIDGVITTYLLYFGALTWWSNHSSISLAVCHLSLPRS